METVVAVMGHPAYAVSDHPARAVSDDVIDAFSGGDEGDEPDETWCVDHGAAMDVMSTRAIRRALARGDLSSSQKVWRDGHPCWQPISDFLELTSPDHADQPGRFEVPERSGPRRIQREPDRASSESASPGASVATVWRSLRRANRSRVGFLSAVFAGILLGLLVLLPFTSVGGLPAIAPALSGHAGQIFAPLAP